MITSIMDDFEKEFPGFDWKNTPAYKHPGGINCPCPKHEYIKEQINNTVKVKRSFRVTLKFCPEHYQVYYNEVIPSLPIKRRIMAKIVLKLNLCKIKEIPYMESQQCFFCKFGSGGFDKKTELPPI